MMTGKSDRQRLLSNSDCFLIKVDDTSPLKFVYIVNARHCSVSRNSVNNVNIKNFDDSRRFSTAQISNARHKFMSKSKTIIFRVTDEQFAQIEKASLAAGKLPNDWCRDLVLIEAGQESEFSPNEKVIFEELAKVRYLLGIGFGLLSTGELDDKSWAETKRQVDNHGEKIAAQILARRKNQSDPS